MAEAVASCVHCGFCLPACPTYLALGEEMDSPRGRILLMKGALEGELEQEEVLPHVDRCLGCLACVTACPSGVEYGDLLTPFREMAEKRRSRSFMQNLTRTLTNQTLPYPARFRAAATLGRCTKLFRRFLPPALHTMLDLLPDRLPPRLRLPTVSPAQGERRARVALLSGCVQQVLTPGVNRATVDLLTRNGVEVVIPPQQGCCGALSMHTGAAEQARRLAKRNFNAFNLDEFDAVVTNAAGCGSGMHEYPLLFAGQAEEQTAADFAAKVQDVTLFLDNLGIAAPPPAIGAGHLRLPRRLSSGPRPRRNRPASPSAVGDSQSYARTGPGRGNLLWFRGELQHRTAGDRRPVGPAQGRSHPQRRRARRRHRQHRLHDPDRQPPAPPRKTSAHLSHR